MRQLTILAAVLVAAFARADAVLTTRQPRITAGEALTVELMIANDADEPLLFDLPSPVHLRFDSDDAVGLLELMPERSGVIEVTPRGFARIRLRGVVPRDAQGTAVLKPTGIEANELMVQVSPATSGPIRDDGDERLLTARTAESRLIDKPPPLAVSVYEPVYFLVGGDDGLNAKFQISFRYRLFDGEGSLAKKLPWIDDLYLSYSQTSLWDLNDLSKPFRDSSYRPRLFFADYDLTRMFDGRLRLGFETGVGHESNGKEGEASRSFNMLYLRPTLTLGNPDGLRMYLAPLLHNYVSDDENPDLREYRGYVDWLFGAGSKGGLDFWATLRKGTRSDFGSIEISASYPLSKLSGGDLTGWVMLQYFGGYGESLLDYSRKLDSQLRLGIAVAL